MASQKTSALLLLLVFLFFPCKVLSAVPQFPSDLRGDSISFLPYLEYVLDEKGVLDAEAISLQEQSLEFRPLRPLDFEMKAGTFWLRFTLAPVKEGVKSVEWLLSLGESMPGDPTLYVPEFPGNGSQRWRAIEVTDRHIVALPQAGAEPKTCYIRLSGPPGLWFAPMLRSPHNAANNWGALAHPAAILVLSVIMLLGLLRCFSERGQWRIWTVLYVGGALAASYYGLPSLENGHIGLSQFVSALAPGVSLMVLPHVARHMMRSSVSSRLVDAQLILLTLIGAAVTLFPLVPGFGQTGRFLELWPLCTIFFIPTALWASFAGLPNSQRFLLICLFPPIFTAAGILGLFSGFPVDTLSALPLCGVIISSLMLVGGPNPPAIEEVRERDLPVQSGSSEMLSLEPVRKRSEKGAVSVGRKKKDTGELNLRSDTPFDSVPQILSLARRLENLDVPYLLKARVTALREQAERLSDSLCGTSFIRDLDEKKNSVIDLEALMRQMYASAVQGSKDTGIALAWYIPPELPTLYLGNAERVQTVFMQLVQSAVAATRIGSVHFTVRHYPNSEDPAHLLFTVTDTGDFASSGKRNGGVLENAWDLAATCRGAVTILSDTQGTTISLALHLGVPDVARKDTRNPKGLIVICSQNQRARAHIKGVLADMPCRFEEAASISEAQEIHANTPAILFIVHDTLATPQAGLIVRTMRKQAQDAGLPLCRVLAITRTDAQWRQLGQAGFTHALLEPLDEEALRQTVSDILDVYSKNIPAESVEPASVQAIPDLFGKGAGSVPKDIDELIDIARVMNSFSSLGTISKKVGAREREIRRNTTLLDTSSLIRDVPEEKRGAGETQGEANEQLAPEKSDEALLNKYIAEGAEEQKKEKGGTWFGDEWVGDPVPVPKKKSLSETGSKT
ncbi:MAG: hypothetical protein IJU76_02665 [Desulfovibrionaceae bacterium]|nr:hypothetical protein [Desulfovibrionaceae bacterium]